MKFAELSIGQHFAFADPVGFSIGRVFTKISARCYIERTHDTKYQVGTVEVRVTPMV